MIVEDIRHTVSIDFDGGFEFSHTCEGIGIIEEIWDTLGVPIQVNRDVFLALDDYVQSLPIQGKDKSDE